MIHPDALDPAADFDGWLRQLVREAREAGADPDGLEHLLRDHARTLKAASPTLGTERDGETWRGPFDGGGDDAEAAAELYRRALDRSGVIHSTGRRGDVVQATTGDQGYHLLNQARDYNADVHLVCETADIPEANLPDGDHGPVFFNVKVRGVRPDATGHGLPTHASTRTGAVIRDDVSDELRRLAVRAGAPGFGGAD